MVRLTNTPVPETHQPKVDRQIMKTRCPTVLLVDNEPGMLESVTLLLEAEGFRVLPASTGAQALERLTESRCDIIVADLMLPYMKGDDLVRRIRSDPHHANIPVVLSGAALPPGSDTPRLADVFLHRPFGIERLIEVIRLLLERRYG